MIFVDSNIPMYLVGAPHPNKTRAQHLLEQASLANERLVTDAEVLQEILHRYVAIHRTDAIQPAFNALLATVDEVIPIEHEDVLAAKDVILGSQQISARDALHVAVLRRHKIESILSFDRGLDDVPGVRRVS